MSGRAWATVGVVFVVYVFLGSRYMQKWESDLVLWPYAAHVTPNNPLPVVNAEIVRRR